MKKLFSVQLEKNYGTILDVYEDIFENVLYFNGDSVVAIIPKTEVETILENREKMGKLYELSPKRNIEKISAGVTIYYDYLGSLIYAYKTKGNHLYDFTVISNGKLDEEQKRFISTILSIRK